MASSDEDEEVYTFTIHLDGKVYQRRAPLTLDVENTVKTTLESVIESKPFADLQSECCKVFLMPSSNVLKLYTSNGGPHPNISNQLNLAVEIKLQEKQKIKKLQKYTDFVGTLHFHFELRTKVEVKKRKQNKIPKRNAISVLMANAKKQTSWASLPEKKLDTTLPKQMLRNKILDFTKDNGGGFAQNSCVWSNRSHASSNKPIGIEYIDSLTGLLYQIRGHTHRFLKFPAELTFINDFFGLTSSTHN